MTVDLGLDPDLDALDRDKDKEGAFLEKMVDLSNRVGHSNSTPFGTASKADVATTAEVTGGTAGSKLIESKDLPVPSSEVFHLFTETVTVPYRRPQLDFLDNEWLYLETRVRHNIRSTIPQERYPLPDWMILEVQCSNVHVLHNSVHFIRKRPPGEVTDDSILIRKSYHPLPYDFTNSPRRDVYPSGRNVGLINISILPNINDIQTTQQFDIRFFHNNGMKMNIGSVTLEFNLWGIEL